LGIAAQARHGNAAIPSPKIHEQHFFGVIMQIVPLYAAALSLLFVFLSIRVIRVRRSLRIGIGDANNPTLLRAMRVHSNFSEYVPLSIILLFFLEWQNAHPAIVHGLCAILVAGRFLHAYGVSQENEKFAFRVSGMLMTFSTIVLSAFYIGLLAIYKSYG
jgi:uncharacterized membrane protein YecN with MAPEG domain